MTEKFHMPYSPIGGINHIESFWPPRIVWGRERGWLLVQDPVDGSWFSIQAKGAPSGWARIASEAKYGRRP